MPTPFPEGQTPIPYSISNATSTSENNDFTGQRLGLSGSSARLQTQTIDGNVTRRWSRLQRRSPLDSNQALYNHSPRARNFSPSAPSSHPSSRQQQPQLLHYRQQPFPQQTQRHFDSPLSQPESYDHGYIVNSSSPHSQPIETSTTSSPSYYYSSSSSPLYSRPDTEQIHIQSSIDPSIRMESSSPTENISNFIASRNTATLTGHQHSAHQSYRSQQSPAVTTVFSSTPMQRSLTHNPAMTSFSSSSSNIAAATSDPSSVSISVISSSPVSSVQTPALSASTSPSRERSTTYSERDHNVESVTGDRDIASNFNSINTSNGIPLDTESEADDRIHFRLLNNIYFSTSTRRPRHGVDLRMNLPVTPNDSELNMNREIVYAGEDSNMVEDAMDYENTRPQVTTQGEESASVMILLQQNHPDSSDEDDDDIDMDHAIENRHIRGAEEMSMDLEPSSPSSSRVERPQNAQLSPRSAAALTNMFSDGRTSWPQPIFNSSISSDLVALSEGRAGHEYDNNPYFRRPPPFSPPREANTRRRIDTGTHNRLRMSNMRPDDASRTRSTSTQYNMIQGGYSSQLTIRGSGITSHGGCGENTQATSNEAQGDVWPLNFEMYHADGGEFNATHSVENVLKNDSSVYCSRRSNNINICLRLAEPHQSFVLTQFRAKAPTAGFTAPCKEGLIFVSHEPISLEKTVIFDNMTREHYEEYMQSLNQGLVFGQMLRSHGANADALIPAAFFQLEGPDETCTLDLTPNRSGRYVLIKLLRSRCTNPLQRPENIDLQYLGLIGFTGARSFASGGLL